eukprot:scaffold18337_cov67-Phaeocystis_antarctica.AAC.1
MCENPRVVGWQAREVGAMKGRQDMGASPCSSTTLPGKGVRGTKWGQGRTDALIALCRHRISDDRRCKHDQPRQPRHGPTGEEDETLLPNIGREGC